MLKIDGQQFLARIGFDHQEADTLLKVKDILTAKSISLLEVETRRGERFCPWDINNFIPTSYTKLAMDLR